MHVVTCESKYIKSHYNHNTRLTNYHNYNVKRLYIKHKITPKRIKVICNSNDYNHEQHNNIQSTEQQKQKVSSYLDNGLFVFITLVFSSVMVLSTCIVMILCARETNIEATNLQEKYNKLYEEVKHLEEKNMEDEIMINAIVGEIIELKSIGII